MQMAWVRATPLVHQKTYNKMLNRGQGLPLSLIVLAIAAALVLVLVVFFTVGGSGATFSKISKVSASIGSEELDTVKAGCRQACDTAKSSVSDASQWVSSAYCSKKSSIDVNGNGKLEDGKDKAGNAASDETNLRCWHPPISIGCSFSVSTQAGTRNINKETADLAAGVRAEDDAAHECGTTDLK